MWIYLPYALGLAIVFAVVILVAVIIQLVRRIGVQSGEIADTLALIGAHTRVIADVAGINRETERLRGEFSRLRPRLSRLTMRDTR